MNPRRTILGSGSGECSQLLYVSKLTLVTAHRPVAEDGSRVTPSDLSAHRASHIFSLPSCLCAVATGQYTESAIFVADHGRFLGEYVVSCVSETCGYRSKSDSESLLLLIFLTAHIYSSF